MPKLDESRPFIPVHIAILTVSDTRTLADDKSGNTLSEMIREAGAGEVVVVAHSLGCVTWLQAALRGITGSASGGMSIALAVTGLTHRESYRDIFAITVIKTLAVFFVIAVFYTTGLV